MHVQSNTAVAACHNVDEAPVRQTMKGDCVEGGTLNPSKRFRENQDVLRGGTMRFAAYAQRALIYRMIRSAFCFERCPLSHRLLDALLV